MALAAPLARVKMTRPPLVDELVHRHRLLAWLDEGIKKPVTLLAAPAGYGKSTLLAEWLSEASHRAAWLSLDEGDDNLSLFANYFVAAIQSIFPGSMRLATGLINSTNASDPFQLVATLSNEIAELPGDFVLVLDDYHTIRDLAVHELMSGLIGLVPAPLHLIISTRTNAPLPLGKLRASGRLGELRARDLRFTLDETRQFLAGVTGREIPLGLVQRLQDRIEGWAVGLRFATLVFRDGALSEEMIERLVSGSDGHLMDYLLNEVLLQKSPAVQEFLLNTSFLPRFTDGLGDAILNLPDGGSTCAILEELVRDEILMVEHDGQTKWYKYLDLFREFLQARAGGRMDARAIAEIHRRASAWFLAQGVVTDAIQHAIAAGDEKCAAQILGENLDRALDQAWARPLIEVWLGLFPVKALDARAELVLARAWLASIALKISALPPLLARAEQLLHAEVETNDAARLRMQGAIAYHRVMLAHLGGDALGTLKLLSENNGRYPVPSEYARGMMLSIEAWTHQMVGNTDLALHLLTAALQQDGSSSLQFTLRLMTGFTTIYLNAADLVNLEKNAQTTLRLTKGDPYLASAAAHLGLGSVYYEWNDLEAAAQNFAAAAELSHVGNLKVGQEAFAWLALTRQAQGSTAAANAAMQGLVAFTDATQSGALLYDMEAYRARLALRQGDVDVALHWAQGITFTPNPHLLFEVEAHLSRLHILLATRKPEMVRTALAETNALLAWVESLHNTRRIIQLVTLQAYARDLLGERVEALDSLERAITLAEPGKWLRTFLDLGPGMARLLNQLASRNRSSAFINRILMASAQNEKKRLAPKPNGGDPASRLIEPLTMRELQVLRGMARRRSNKEIAQELVISPQTVKAHIDHIHQKLGVNNRQDATKVAIAFGIIEVPAGIG